MRLRSFEDKPLSCMGFSCENICNAVVGATKLKMDDFRGQGQDCAYDRRATAQMLEALLETARHKITMSSDRRSKLIKGVRVSKV